MTSQGTIVRWNAGHGFGYILEDYSQTEIFVHQAAFHDKTRPSIGERVSFNIITNTRNKQEAQAVTYLDRPKPTTASAQPSIPQPVPTRNKIYRAQQPFNLDPLTLLLMSAMIGGIAYFAHHHHNLLPDPLEAIAPVLPLLQPETSPPAASNPPARARIVYEKIEIRLPTAQTAGRQIATNTPQ